MDTKRPPAAENPNRHPSYDLRNYPVGITEFVNTFPPERRQEVAVAIRHLRFKRKGEEKWVNDQIEEMTELPPILYKYAPCGYLDLGFPTTLRATQPSILNDVMEGNIRTGMEAKIDRDKWYDLIYDSVTGIFGEAAFTYQELQRRKNRYGDPRISTIVREYLSRFVGVVSFSSDPLIPTMWAHYAQNSGFVVGYNTEILLSLGEDLRRVLYLEFAPSYTPTRDNMIRFDFVDEERRKEYEKDPDGRTGTPLLNSSVNFLELRKDWRELSKVLFVKGHTWQYEQEVRLLVDLAKARPPAQHDNAGYGIHLLDIPTEAIQEVYVGFNTPEDEIRHIKKVVSVGRGKWKLRHTDSHAYRMQVTSTFVSDRKDAPVDR